MKNDKKNTLSGFAGINSGEIENCYTDIKINSKKQKSGFCSLNLGKITKSYYLKPSGKKEDKKVVSDELGKAKEELSEESLKNSDWDLEEIWKIENGVPVLRNQCISAEIEESDMYVEISTAQQLFEVAAKVNTGDIQYRKGHFILTKDIDLQKKKWIPMGINELTPFCGSFDGNGYEISNYIVSGGKAENAGFFGYLKNAAIRNLQLQGTVTGGKYTGALAGVNDGGAISCCFSKSKVKGKFCVGGLVGKNGGTIQKSYCGGITAAQHSWKFVAGGAVCLAGAAGVAASVWIHGNNQISRPAYYPPVPISSDAKMIKGDNDTPRLGENKVAFSFATEVKCNKGDGKAQINFENPGRSSHHIVVQLQITDAELIKVIGKNGRTPEDQKELEDSGQYSAENMRIVLSESGTIPPGYKMDTMELSSLPDGTVLPDGTYNAIVYLILYDVQTNEKAMINSQTPVKLVIGKKKK
ncbi:hypothetical protein [Anaeromicropila populeti]|uniref:The GLUG motif-containing protein n=1 Tax=Anaeromicropila populeti TaxID=37658 RepID=A0A1I6LUV4_9FIRM|nr:hypothetical protein [Anaeromicropila populeti]SFS07194.1 hypothetical protein SAMN05661086_03587 [Anaeromicropila populeti]